MKQLFLFPILRISTWMFIFELELDISWTEAANIFDSMAPTLVLVAISGKDDAEVKNLDRKKSWKENVEHEWNSGVFTFHILSFYNFYFLSSSNSFPLQWCPLNVSLQKQLPKSLTYDFLREMIYEMLKRNMHLSDCPLVTLEKQEKTNLLLMGREPWKASEHVPLTSVDVFIDQNRSLLNHFTILWKNCVIFFERFRCHPITTDFSSTLFYFLETYRIFSRWAITISRNSKFYLLWNQWEKKV